MLKQRVITAIFLITGILAALFLLPPHGFGYLIVAVFALAAWEWADMSALSGQLLRVIYAAIVAAASLLALNYIGLLHGLPDTTRLRDVLGVGCSFWALMFLWVRTYPGSAMIWGHFSVRSIMGLFVLVPAAVALVYVTSLSGGRWLFLYIIGIVASADIGAYFVGRQWGNRKLAVQVSPGKSWAGFWGGLVCSMVFAAVMGSLFSLVELTLPALILVTVITALASVLGDLVESMVKRHRGIKDSSQLLPGHGGVMDRIDSMTAAAPVFTLLLVLLQAAG